MLFVLPRQTDHLISDASDNAFVVACKFPESDLSILSDQVLPNWTSGCRVMSQTQVLCEEMVIIVWVLSFFLNCLSWLCLPKWRSAVTLIGTYSSHFFLVSKTVARPTLLLLSLILHKVWASPWNTWGDFWNKNVWFLHLDMFSNMQVMCGTRTHSCMDESLWATHSFWWKS